MWRVICVWDFQDLFRRHHKELRRFLRGRVSSAEVAADLTQDVFLRMLTAAPGNVDDQQAYLFRAARNLALNHNKRERLVTYVNDPDALLSIRDDAPNAEQALLSRQELAVVAGALAEFSPLHREIFILSRLDGMTYQAIGQRLGIPMQTAFSHVVRMLTRAQLRLAEAGH
jgi:RNA polymerase sigma factor (sigma-70 family)